MYILRVQTNRARNEKIAENDQTETIVCTYNQNTYTLLYKLQRRDESKEQSVNITYLTIFASQRLPSAPLLFTLGRLSQNCVILAYRPLADLWSTAHLHYIIIYQWERLYYYLFEGVVPKTSFNWANTSKVSVNIVLLCLRGKYSWQSLQFSPDVSFVYIFLSLHVIVAWSLVRRILIGCSHPQLHRIAK
jgi:hypothetical protein